MKDWLTIGQFSKRTGVSARALRIYEEKGLITSHTRGENGYRYYQESQYFYFSKNKGLEDQIKRIGGILSDGEEIKIFGFNSKPQTLNFKLNKMLSHGEEVAMIASLAAVLDIGLKQEALLPALT